MHRDFAKKIVKHMIDQCFAFCDSAEASDPLIVTERTDNDFAGFRMFNNTIERIRYEDVDYDDCVFYELSQVEPK